MVAVATAVAAGDIVYLLGLRRPFAINAVLFSVVLLLGAIIQLGLMYFSEEEDLSDLLGAVASSIFIVLRDDWTWSDLLTKRNTAFASIRDTTLFLLTYYSYYCVVARLDYLLVFRGRQMARAHADGGRNRIASCRYGIAMASSATITQIISQSPEWATTLSTARTDRR